MFSNLIAPTYYLYFISLFRKIRNMDYATNQVKQNIFIFSSPKFNMKALLCLAALILLLSPQAIPHEYEKDALTSSPFHPECKEIVAIGNATAGNYTLLLKVRDPARPGWQVLCMVPAGYEYDYHHPWTGWRMHFVVRHKFIGTTTVVDTPPNITKAGMLLTDAGIAFGDADVFSYLVNPTRNAWDDFDWLRYAAQSSDNINDAINLTIDAVKRLHASGVAENIFIAGSNKAAIVEADAFNYKLKTIENGVAAQTNYPKMMWKNDFVYPLFVASSFSSNVTEWVERGDRLNLHALFGIRVVAINNDSITVRQYPIGMWKEIHEGEGATVGYFWVEVKSIENGRALVEMRYSYNEWEREMMNIINAKYGRISLMDMMNWSRLHSRALNGLRGMCEGGYEAATIYKIPEKHADMLSCLWFAADQCSSIFVPVHICDYDIYDAYENGEASKIASQLLSRYGHGNLTQKCMEIEREFIEETEKAEKEAASLIKEGKIQDAIILLTLSDIKLQMKAISIEREWLSE